MIDTAAEGSALPDEIVEAVDEVLRQAFGADAACRSSTILRVGRSTVARLELLDAPVASVIAKFGPDADLLWNEWAGLAFLSGFSGLSGQPAAPAVPSVPAFYGAGRFEHRQTAADGSEPDTGRSALVVMEDLGEHPSLADILVWDGDRDAAEAGLTGYVDALADLHLATFGRRAEYTALRSGLGTVHPQTEPLLDRSWPRLTETIAELGIGSLPDKVDGAVRWIDDVLQPEGPWHAFTVADCCPDNNLVRPDGLRLFDLEFSEFRHALLDLAYLHTTMPTCWCVRRLPAGLADRLVQRYRDRLVGLGAPVDLGDFDRGRPAPLPGW